MLDGHSGMRLRRLLSLHPPDTAVRHRYFGLYKLGVLPMIVGAAAIVLGLSWLSWRFGEGTAMSLKCTRHIRHGRAQPAAPNRSRGTRVSSGVSDPCWPIMLRPVRCGSRPS